MIPRGRDLHLNVFVHTAGDNAVLPERNRLPSAWLRADDFFSRSLSFWINIPARFDQADPRMSLPLPANSGMPGAFLGVEHSVCGRTWRARLDPRGEMRATSMAQRYGVPELLARVLAGRGVEPDAVMEFLDPSVRRLMSDPDTLTDMPKAA